MSIEQYPHSEIIANHHLTRVSLLLRSSSPIDSLDPSVLDSAAIIAGQAARTCYSSTLQTPQDYLDKSDKYRAVTDKVVQSTKESGHLTTRQHVYYTFALEGVSRNAIYFLHSHPHYNSEMVSQRYVNFANTETIIPELSSPELDVYAQETARMLVAGYDALTEVLLPTVKHFLLERFPGRDKPKWASFIDKEAQKKAQEIARYCLPLGTPSHLYHSISELTLIRLFRLSKTLPAQPEIANLIQGMVDTVAQVDPSIYKELEQPLEPSSQPLDYAFSYKEEFDTLLSNSSVKLDLDFHDPSAKLIRAVRLITGQGSSTLSDEDALCLIIDPSQNPHLSSTLGEITLDHLSQALNQVNLSAVVSLSHTANEQLHRHRGLNHTTPLLLPIPTSTADIVTPLILQHNPEALALFHSIHNENSTRLNYLLSQGVPLESLQYLLTNATRVRKTISGPLGAFYHFIKARTCYTAQEEIFAIAVGLANQIGDLDPRLGAHFTSPAPCGIRHQAGITPFCPEGDRFCGIRIWNFELKNYPPRTI